MALFKNDQDSEIRWLFYYLNSNAFNIYVGIVSVGGVKKFISLDNIRNWKIPFPSLNYQKQIVNFLDKKTLAIDKAIEKNKKLIELLEEKRTSLINHVVTGKLNFLES
ncbi:MAG: restriction endonuclease subunit S [Methanobrevibacter sp.]|nr:restriction endonuclease subunit S [Methanobrevibacter sp.]